MTEVGATRTAPLLKLDGLRVAFATPEESALRTLARHPGLEPGSTGQPLERLKGGSRLKAGMTVGVAEGAE